MVDETPVIEAAKAAAHAPTLAELEADLIKRKQIEGKIRVAAAQKEINAVCARYGVSIRPMPRIAEDGRIGADIAWEVGPTPKANGETREG